MISRLETVDDLVWDRTEASMHVVASNATSVLQSRGSLGSLCGRVLVGVRIVQLVASMLTHLERNVEWSTPVLAEPDHSLDLDRRQVRVIEQCRPSSNHCPPTHVDQVLHQLAKVEHMCCLCDVLECFEQAINVGQSQSIAVRVLQLHRRLGI